MKKRIAFLSVCLVFSALSLAWAADVNGKWVAQVPGREGQTRETTFTFKVEGGKLTGTVSGRQGDTPISDGKIDGDNISFSRTINAGGNSIKVNYKGKVSGDEIKFTVTREGGEGQPQEFTAKRSK
jgi:autotransporter translocation and assembly factor TamB